MDDSTTNSQITDAVTQNNTLVVGEGPAQSRSILDVVMSDAVGLGMFNAVSAQQHAQTLGGAATAATCARILSAALAPSAGAATPHVPLPLRPGPSPGPPSTAAARRLAEAREALHGFSATVESGDAVIEEAKRKINRLFPEAALKVSRDRPEGSEEAR